MLNPRARFLTKRAVFFVAVLGCFIGFLTSRPVSATSLFSKPFWQSAVLPEEVVSVAYGDLNNDWQLDIAWASGTQIQVLTYDAGRWPVWAQLKAGSQERFIRIDVGDWNFDGRRELLVSGWLRGGVFSRLYELQGQKFKSLKEFGSLVSSVSLEGRPQLCSQRYLGQGRWAPVADILVQKGKKWISKGQLTVQKGLAQNQLSLWSMVGLGAQQVVLTGEQKLLVQKQGAKLWKSGVSYGGVAGLIDLKERDPLGLNQRQKRMVVPTRMVVERQDLYVIKNDEYLKSVVGIKPHPKSSQIVRLRWEGENGLAEVHNSPRYGGAITDLRLIDFNGDGRLELLVSFLVRQSGYLDQFSAQKSRIAIVAIGD